jgi:hypothetical protein
MTDKCFNCVISEKSIVNWFDLSFCFEKCCHNERQKTGMLSLKITNIRKKIWMLIAVQRCGYCVFEYFEVCKCWVCIKWQKMTS